MLLNNMAHSLNSCRHYLFALVYDEFNFLSSAPALKGETQKKKRTDEFRIFCFFPPFSIQDEFFFSPKNVSYLFCESALIVF
jgi:hypothetical protein